MRSRVLLLGPNGQLGRDILRAHGKSGGAFDLLPLARDKLDVAEPGAVERVLGGLDYDAAVNCAAYTRVDEVEDNATLAFAVNAHAAAAMAQVCASKRARLVHISTDYVFGGDVERASPLREDDPTEPINVYGASKAMGETLARLASDDVVILRVASLFGVAGAGGKGQGDGRDARPPGIVRRCRHPSRRFADSLRHRGVSGARRATALQRARQREGLGRLRRHAAVAGCARPLPARQGMVR